MEFPQTLSQTLKDMKNSQNPFLKYGYIGPEFFAGRTVETTRMAALLTSGNNVTLLSPRRMGKTGLIMNVFHRLRGEQPEAVLIYLDIFATRTFHDFVQQLAASSLQAVQSRGGRLFSRLVQVLAALRPVITTDEITGAPAVTITAQPEAPAHTIEQILGILEQSGRPCYVAIDEFQQVASYADVNAEAVLRAQIQFLKNVHFVFAGSSKHLMTDIFLSAKRPFYQSTSIIDLPPIAIDDYATFALHHFAQAGLTLRREVFDEIYSRFEGHTWYVQAVLNELYDRHVDVLDKSAVDAAVEQLVNENNALYENITALLTRNQLLVLRALAIDGPITQSSGGDFLRSTGLKSTSSLMTALKNLDEKELIYRRGRQISVYDRFMALWLKSRLANVRWVL